MDGQHPSAPSDDLQSIVDDLALRIGRSVALDDAELRLLAHSAHVGDEDEARMASLLQRRVSPERFAWSREVGVLSATRPFHTPSAEHLGVRKRFIVPLRADRELLAIIWIIDDGTLDPDSVDLVLEAADRLRAILVRRSMATEDARRREAALVHDLLSADPTRARSAAAEFAARDTFPRADRWFTLLIRVQEDGAAAEPLMPVRAAERALGHRVDGLAITSDGETTIVLVGTARAWAPEALTELAESVRRELRTFDPRSEALVAFGAPVADLDSVAESYAQSRTALRIAEVRGQPVAIWGTNGVDDLLAAVLPSALSDALVPPVIAQLVAAQPAEVLEAVRVFLDEGGNAARTGTRLHLHRTTVYYRLSRFQETTGLDLERGDTRLLLQLWFKAGRYIR
jgi:DNA-binding PucR family transcriptional regulator